MIIKIFSMMIMLAGYGLASAGSEHGPDIQGDLLCRWPRDFRGEAIIPSSVRHIESSAFAQCKEMTAVRLPEKLECIGQLAFIGCSELRDVRIPCSVTNIGRSAFFECSKLTNAVIHASVSEMSGNVFANCYSLRHVKLPNGLVALGDMNFRGCRSLQSIVIPDSVRRIGRATFLGCRRLSQVELPSGIERIDEFAFAGCYDLSRFVLHSVFKEIGTNAFAECYNLRGCVVSDPVRYNAVYSALFSTGDFCDDERLIGKYETLEDALRAADKLSGDDIEAGYFKGLAHALRLAADGMADEMPDSYPVYDKLDSMAAGLFKLIAADNVKEVKDYFKLYALMSGDTGGKFVATLSVCDDIAITMEFQDDRLTTLTLSDGLKNIVRRRLEKEGVLPDEGVLKWLQ